MTPSRQGHPAPAPFLLGPALGRNKTPRLNYFYIKTVTIYFSKQVPW